jgi:ADP-ribose pyrophosphatase YjhB (NUDIX family)
LRSIAEAGLAYSRDPFDRERFARLQQLAADLSAAGAGLTADQVLPGFLADSGYVTPKLDVRAVVFEGSKALMVRERSDGGWTFPGGWVEPGESLREAAEKEVREESGLVVRALRVLAIDERDRHGHPPLLHAVWKVFVLCELLGGDLQCDGHEILAAGWFGEDEVPPLSETRLMPEQVRRMFAHHSQPAAPTEFD